MKIIGGGGRRRPNARSPVRGGQAPLDSSMKGGNCGYTAAGGKKSPLKKKSLKRKSSPSSSSSKKKSPSKGKKSSPKKKSHRGGNVASALKSVLEFKGLSKGGRHHNK
jgi:hypothetical protein